jgi:hypothetical protein
MTSSSLEKLLNKLNLEVNNYSKNFLINKYFEEKELKLKNDYKVSFVEVGNTKNLSGYILLKTNIESMKLSKQQKKSKSYYIEVIFAGLRQPTKDIGMRTYEVLNHFIKRAKVSTIDICCDGSNRKSIDKKLYHSSVFDSYIGQKTRVKLVGTTFYINNPSSPSDDTDYFLKIMLYDKYIKESRHKLLDTAFKDWKRLEFRVSVNEKLKDISTLEDYAHDVINVAKEYFTVSSIDSSYFIQQVGLLTDKRTQRGKTL